MYKKATQQDPSPGHLIPHYVKMMPIVISAIGISLVASVAWPMVSYFIFSSNLLTIFTESETTLLSPTYYEASASQKPLADNQPTVLTGIDYTKAGNWFINSLPQDNLIQNSLTEVVDIHSYEISIPSLGIANATVRNDIDDLSVSLVQYPQTAPPGRFGSPVIFGHSTLPQLFDPSDYTTIFATLPTIKPGADIMVTYAGVKYTYRVQKTYEVKPSDVWVLRQVYDKKTLKLVTCVPPGTKLKRLIVEAELISS